MLEAKLEEFRSLVERGSTDLLTGIKYALATFYPSSSPEDYYVGVNHPSVEISCLLGIGAEQMRVGISQAKNIVSNDITLLIFEIGEYGGTRSFTDRDQALEAYHLVGSDLLVRHTGRNDITFKQNLRHMIKLDYQGSQALLAIYADENPQSSFEYGILHMQQEVLQIKYHKHLRGGIVRGIIDNAPIEGLPAEITKLPDLKEKAA